MVIIFADVDERVRAESKVRALVEAIPDIIVRLRSDGTVLAIKEGNRLNYAVGAPKSIPAGLFDAILASEAGARVMDAIRTAAERKELVQIHCRLKNDTDDPSDYDLRIVSNGPDEVICIVRDVTREKIAEEQAARGKKLEAIGELAAGLAHEINTPLQYVGDNLDFVKDAIPPLLTLMGEYHDLVHAGKPVSTETLATLGDKEQSADLPYMRESLAKILGNGLDGIAQISRIVRAMKTFEHVGRQERTQVELNTIVENATVVVTHAWKPFAEVSIRLAAGLPLVPCVAGEIAQVVMNLVINAAQAIADKGGNSEKPGHITVETALYPASESVEIRITDDGVGIPEAIRARVFDPFFSTRPVGQGKGQGLTQVHAAVVRLHGGTVHFNSSEGQGTTFVVRLPLRS